MADAVVASSMLTNFLGTTATVTTIGQFLSGMYVFNCTTPTVQNIPTHISIHLVYHLKQVHSHGTTLT